MCRFIAYQGEPVFVGDIICASANSLVQQSRCAQEGKTTKNEDGFGLGWYDDQPIPRRYGGVEPAWANDGLSKTCRGVRSAMFFAHVRASTGTATSLSNCHPFSHREWLFMHNGQVGNYQQIRGAIEAMIPARLLRSRLGTTDSEAIFLAAIGNGLLDDPPSAMTSTLQAICALMALAGITETLRFSAALTDGTTLFAFRWANRGRPPRVYYRGAPNGLVVASEPTDGERQRWHEIPSGCSLISRRGRPPVVRSFGYEPLRGAA